MKNKKPYYIFGGILCLLAAVFVGIALTHPELSFPWPNWVSYIMYGLYAVYTVLVFLMPRFKGASLAACAILALQFIALSFVALSIGLRVSTGEPNLYLPIGLALNCAALIICLVIHKKKKVDNDE